MNCLTLMTPAERAAWRREVREHVWQWKLNQLPKIVTVGLHWPYPQGERRRASARIAAEAQAFQAMTFAASTSSVEQRA